MHTRRTPTPKRSGLHPSLQWLATAALSAVLMACGGGSGPDYAGAGGGNTGTPGAIRLGAGTPVTGLKISEISSCSSYTIDCWIEVYNAEASAIDLQDYKLESWSRPAAGGASSNTPVPFTLPHLVIPGKSYAVIAGYTSMTAPTSGVGPLAWVNTNVGVNASVPYWDHSGFFNIVRKSTGTSEDFVLLGNTTNSSTASWTGASVATLTAASGNTTHSIVRRDISIATTDTNSASDWEAVGLSTPGGANDVAGGATVASDGMPSNVFGGLIVSSSPVRISLQAVLNANGYLTALPTTTTREAALQAIVDKFSGH